MIQYLIVNSIMARHNKQMVYLQGQ